ncbi:hypothetical protein NDU88_003161 [Pleurodeles waltl]|uniref:Uncharacterized protein n=1 Tax=Pleurodeles waltl TaxID=8319 RepID=A0AAV7PBX3_PLEWA|nr:hypothetical protein NDU88_003161 [Pleurodeles waltl]
MAATATSSSSGGELIERNIGHVLRARTRNLNQRAAMRALTPMKKFPARLRVITPVAVQFFLIPQGLGHRRNASLDRALGETMHNPGGEEGR